MPEGKVVHDAVHGSIRFDGCLLRLLDSPEVQRLNGIKQLGFAYLVFPGANHTRLEHSIGVSHMAGVMGERLGFSDEELEFLRVAGLLHDIAHTPFSHALEFLLHSRVGKDHMEVGREIITGKVDILAETPFEDSDRVCEILKDCGHDPERVSKAILGAGTEGTLFRRPDRESALFSVIHGPLDADQLDYLVRDAYYTGVAHGVIDLPRILNTVVLHDNEILWERGGVPALEGLFVARALMYNSVYFHKTSRIAELMITRALEEVEMEDWNRIFSMNDADLMALLRESGGFAREVYFRIKHRQLYKIAYSITPDRVSGELLERIRELGKMEKRRQLEESIAFKAGIEPEYVLIDVPYVVLRISEPRFWKMNVMILDDGRRRNLLQVSPLAKALREKSVVQVALMVTTLPQFRERVGKIAERTFVP